MNSYSNCVGPFICEENALSNVLFSRLLLLPLFNFLLQNSIDFALFNLYNFKPYNIDPKIPDNIDPTTLSTVL